MPAQAQFAVKPSLTLKRRLNAAPEKVYAAWTDPAQLAKWFGPKDIEALRVESDPRVGGRFSIVMRGTDACEETGAEEHHVSGVYREVVPNEKLVFTWAWRSTPERESLVTVLIKPDGAGSLLTLIHEQFFDEEARDRHEHGWTGCLDKLETLSRVTECIMQHQVVSREQWLAARKAYLAKEKEFTRARDRLSAERRALPWVKIDKPYVFDTPDGKKTLADLFDGHSQLIVYHFMLGPDWIEGCPSCSLLADHFDGCGRHLAQRDVMLTAVSRAPCPRSRPTRSAWAGAFPGSRPMAATSTPTTRVLCAGRGGNGRGMYNYQEQDITSDEMPGLSVFYRDADGSIFIRIRPMRAARHLDRRLQFLDLAPKGRDEDTCPGPWPGCAATTNMRTRSGCCCA